MSFWSVDLSKWGELIRQWMPTARELATHGATFVGPVHVQVESVGTPLAHDGLVEIPISLTVSVKHQLLADLIRLDPVKLHGNLSAKLPVFSWPVVTSDGGAIRISWPEGTRPLVNIPALDPRVAAVTIEPDGYGTIEIQRGPDGTITY